MIALEYDRDWREAERAFQRALELNPNDATAHQQYGLYLREVGRFGQAIEEAKKAEQVRTGDLHGIACSGPTRLARAGDGDRTHDSHVGNVALYL